MRRIIYLQNYESCFDRTHGLATKAELSKPYQIINRTSRVGIRFPAECYGVYVFSIKVLDPDFRYVQKIGSRT